jgi:hypothetical protein
MSKATEEIVDGPLGGKRYSHPAMVTVSFHRVQGQTSLFGSTIKHNNYVTLSIQRAELNRSLSSDWIHASHIPLIEVDLSPYQFAELITTLNTGSGIPGTLKSLQGEHFESPELPTKAQHFKEEMTEAFKKNLKDLLDAQKEVKASLSDDKPLGKRKREEILYKIDSLERLVQSTLPFILDRFSEQMENTVTEAKSAVDAFVNHTIVETGLEALRNSVSSKNLMIEEKIEDGQQ